MTYDIDDLLDSLDTDGYNLEPTAPHDAGKPVAQATKLYRIEMADGCGPWCSGDHSRSWCGKLENWGCQELAALNDEQMGITEAAFRKAHGHGCYGCDSLDAMAKWFPRPAREYLAKHGASLIVYELAKGKPLLAVGHGEVIFSRADCARVGTLDVVTLA